MYMRFFTNAHHFSFPRESLADVCGQLLGKVGEQPLRQGQAVRVVVQHTLKLTVFF